MLAFLLPACKKEKPNVTSKKSVPDYRQKQLLTELKESEDLTTYADIGDGRFAILHADSVYQHSKIEVYDIQTKKMIGKPKEYNCFVEICRSFEDGTVLLQNDSLNYYLYTPDTGESWVIDVPVVPGYFNHDMSEYYYANNDVLYCMNMSSKESKPVSNEYALPIYGLEGIHPTEDFLSVYTSSSAYTLEETFGILNPKTGKFLSFGNIIQQNPVYNDERFYDIFFDSKTKKYSIHYGDFNKTDSLKNIPLPEFEKQNSPSILFLENSDYALVQYPLNNDADIIPEKYRTEIWCFGDMLRKYVISDELTNTHFLENATYLPEENLIVSLFSIDKKYTTVLIDPHFVKFNEISTPERMKEKSFINETLMKENKLENCPENLKEFRTQIDLLQERYDIQIIIGKHSQRILRTQGHKTELMEDPKKIKDSLHELKTSLARYPDDFFRQFKDDNGNGGVTFLLCGDFWEEDVLGTLKKGGHSESYGTRYFIACNCNTPRVYHHEIWHATEYLILQKNPYAFDKWDNLNPEGYSYDDYDIVKDSEPNKWTLDSFGNEEVYFTDNYGRTSPKEDRANLMQYAMDSLIPSDELTPEKPLYKKLQFITRAFKFDLEIPIWEKDF